MTWSHPDRRTLLLGSAAAFLPGCGTLGSRKVRPGQKLNLGVIGCGNRGWDNFNEMLGENVLAICDVDEHFLAKAAEKAPGARRCIDFRELLDLKDLHAVVISTPDHTHATAAAAALRRGLDVYCEKPLTHSVHEARVLRALAAEHGAITQLGTQIHSWPNYHRVVEIVQSGGLGAIHAAHVWVNGTDWSATAPPRPAPLPGHVHWDLWLGPAAARPFSPGYHPAGWRRYWNFGGGTLGDMGCHYLDLAFWALGLGLPATVTAQGPAADPECAPKGLTVHYEFTQPQVALTWYGGSSRPPVLAQYGLADWHNGVLFVGERGWLCADYTRKAMGPAGFLAGFEPPAPFVPDSIGHHKEWIEACKSRVRTTCDFAYSALLSEAVLLGNAAHRLGKRIEWDAVRGEARGCPEAAPLLAREYRPGWTL